MECLLSDPIILVINVHLLAIRKAIVFAHSVHVLYCTYLCLLIFLLHHYMLTFKRDYCFQLNVMVTLHKII